MLQMEVGMGEETRGVMWGGEENACAWPLTGAKPPQAFPRSVENAPCAHRKSLRSEILNCDGICDPGAESVFM